MIPPDWADVPPPAPERSSARTSAPASEASMAAQVPAMPRPTTTTSATSSQAATSVERAGAMGSVAGSGTASEPTAARRTARTGRP